MIFLTSSVHDSAQTPVPGTEAPVLKINDDADLLAEARANGAYVVVSFWTPTDAASRMENARCASLAAKRGAQLISICLDDSDASLARQIAAADGIAPRRLYLASQAQRRAIMRTFAPSAQARSFLVDPSGRIAAVGGADRMAQALAA